MLAVAWDLGCQPEYHVVCLGRLFCASAQCGGWVPGVSVPREQGGEEGVRRVTSFYCAGQGLPRVKEKGPQEGPLLGRNVKVTSPGEHVR